MQFLLFSYLTHVPPSSSAHVGLSKHKLLAIMNDSRNDQFVIAKKGNVPHCAYVHFVNLPSEKVTIDSVPSCGNNYKDEKTFIKPSVALGFSCTISILFSPL